MSFIRFIRVNDLFFRFSGDLVGLGTEGRGMEDKEDWVRGRLVGWLRRVGVVERGGCARGWVGRTEVRLVREAWSTR